MPSRISRLIEEHVELVALAERLLAMAGEPIASPETAFALVGRIETALHAHLEGERGFPYMEILHRDLDWSPAVKQRRDRDLRELAYDLEPYFGHWSADRIASDRVGFAEATMWNMTRLLRRIATEDSILRACAHLGSEQSAQ